MSAAVECDGCGKLVPVLDALTLEVKQTLEVTEEGSKGVTWSGVDVCRDCWERPFAWVLNNGCQGLNLPRDLPSDEVYGILSRDAAPPAPEEP